MTREVPVSEDSRSIVECVPMIETGDFMNHQVSPDAIFVPFRSRCAYINALLRELEWYQGTIYLMPSTPSDLRSISWTSFQHVEPLYVQENVFTLFFDSLLTSSLKWTTQFAPEWDLPIKRNYALWYSRKRGYTKILLLDDDIRGLTFSTLFTGSSYLDKYNVTGCFVSEFPDLSIAYHLERLHGNDTQPFLSGSFLFLKPDSCANFFPWIYNEDWLFMIPYISERAICSFGSIGQMPYDPFNDIITAAFQEFGDIIAEGLYELLRSNNYADRYDLLFWQEKIVERRQLLIDLRTQPPSNKFKQLLDSALNVNDQITSPDCLSFIENWEEDLVSWESFIKEV